MLRNSSSVVSITRRARLVGLAAAVTVAGCTSPFGNSDFLAFDPPPEQTREILAQRLEQRATGDLVSVDEASARLEELMAQGPDRPTPPDVIEFSQEEVRAAALQSNLDLEVQLIEPAIAQTAVDVEEAKFEAVLTGSISRSSTDSPTSLATEGSQGDFTSINAGLRIPLRTGGTATIDVPLSKTGTNNAFALLDPSYAAAAQFSLSQPLLRGAGNRTNTHSIRIAKYQAQIVDARTKLEAIRILANADRAYWRLYAAQRELEVREQQYRLAMDQLARARRRVEAGDAAEIETMRAESGLAERVQGIIITRTVLRRAQRDLKRIMNLDDLAIETETAIELTTEPDPVGYELDPLSLAGFALENRMEMLELEIQLAIDSSTIDVRRNETLPLFTLDYTYRLNGLGSDYREASDQVFDTDFADWSVGVRGELPLGNEAARGRLHDALLRRIQRLSSRELRELAIRQEVYDAIDQLRQDWQRIIAARHEVLVAGRTYEGEQRQFEVGARTSTDVLDAATRLADAQSREIAAITSYQISQIDLAFATGTLLGYGKVRWQPIDPEFDLRTPNIYPGWGPIEPGQIERIIEIESDP